MKTVETELIDRHHASLLERLQLDQCCRNLVKVTQSHDVWCDCPWCEARLLLDPSDPDAHIVRCRLARSGD